MHRLSQDCVPAGETGGPATCLPQKLLPLCSLQHKTQVILICSTFPKTCFLSENIDYISDSVLWTDKKKNLNYIFATLYFAALETMPPCMATSTASPISASCLKPKVTMMRALAIGLTRSFGSPELMEMNMRDL